MCCSASATPVDTGNGTGSPISGCTCCHHNMYNILKVGNFRMDFNPYELCTQTYTQKYSHFEKILTLEKQLLCNI